MPGVSAEAHVEGGRAGAALALWFDRSPRPHRGVSAVGALLAGAAVFLGFLAAMRYAPAWRALCEPPPAREIGPSIPPEGDAHRAGAAQALAGLAPARLGRLAERPKRDFILGKHAPKSFEEAEALRGDAESASESLRRLGGAFEGRCAAYAVRVREFADEIASWQQRPPRSSLDGVEAKLAAALTAWAELSRPE